MGKSKVKIDPELVSELNKGRRDLYRAALAFTRAYDNFMNGKNTASSIEDFSKFLFKAAKRYAGASNDIQEIMEIEEKIKESKKQTAVMETEFEATPLDELNSNDHPDNLSPAVTGALKS